MEAGMDAEVPLQEAVPPYAQATAAAAEARLTGGQPEIILPADPVVMEARRKFNAALEDELLDYKHNHAVKIENCANTLIKVFTNVVDQPGEEKFRSVKALGNTFKTHVSGIKGGEHLMTLAGWKVQVRALEKFWVFDSVPGSHKWTILQDALALLQKAVATIHEKAERKRNEGEAKAAAEKKRLDSVTAALEDDRITRKTRAELQAASRASVTAPTPAAH